jgi:hypothetical protein
MRIRVVFCESGRRCRCTPDNSRRASNAKVEGSDGCTFKGYDQWDPGAHEDDAKRGIYPFPIADLFNKALNVGSGQAPVKRYNEYLRDLIVNGRAKPSKIVSHHIRIDQAPEAYKKFDQRADGYTKILIRFQEKAAA